MATLQPNDSITTEALRIEHAYARRGHRHHPQWESPAHVFGHQERERNVLALLSRCGFLPLAEKRILEVGCGSGAWIHQLIRWGARPGLVTGVDLLAERIGRARETLPAAVRLECGNAAQLPFDSGSFDIVLQSMMFTSVLDPGIRRQIASEMLRVLKPRGLIVWYDFFVDNPVNPDVRGVRKREIVELFSGCSLDLRRVTLAPPVLRWVAPRSWFLAYVMSHVPPFCTHYLGVITRLVTRT